MRLIQVVLCRRCLIYMVDEILRFIYRYSGYPIKDIDSVITREVIEKHIEYKTCLVVYDNFSHISAVARWNISKDMTPAHILDLIIRPDIRDKGYMKRMLLQGLKMYPSVKYLTWERDKKYPTRQQRTYSIDRLLGGIYVIDKS